MDTHTLQTLSRVDEELLRYVATRPSWSYRAIAEYLHADRGTVKIYAEQICPNVADFRSSCPIVNGRIESGFSLSPYQFWVLAKTLTFARIIRTGENGKAYRLKVGRGLLKYQVYVSLKVFQSHLQTTQKVA
jgi:hypothetical protein